MLNQVDPRHRATSSSRRRSRSPRRSPTRSASASRGGLETANAAEWERRAMMALRAGNEQLAKEALNRKREHDEGSRRRYSSISGRSRRTPSRTPAAARALNDKIEEAKRKKNVLIARKKCAEAQKAIQETMHGLKDQSAFETFGGWGRRSIRSKPRPRRKKSRPRSTRRRARVAVLEPRKVTQRRRRLLSR